MQAKQRILTIPNVLSMLRIGMIPLIVWLYSAQHRVAAAVMLILSGLTDVVDGFIARRCNLITDLGKVLDPIADKLTQAVVLFYLTSEKEGLMCPLLLLVVKESIMAISGLIAIRRTGIVTGADWHGKAATALLYFTMFLHLVMQDMPAVLSNVLIAACVVMMTISLALYTRRSIRAVKRSSTGGE